MVTYGQPREQKEKRTQKQKQQRTERKEREKEKKTESLIASLRQAREEFAPESKRTS